MRSKGVSPGRVLLGPATVPTEVETAPHPNVPYPPPPAPAGTLNNLVESPVVVIVEEAEWPPCCWVVPVRRPSPRGTAMGVVIMYRVSTLPSGCLPSLLDVMSRGSRLNEWKELALLLLLLPSYEWWSLWLCTEPQQGQAAVRQPCPSLLLLGVDIVIICMVDWAYVCNPIRMALFGFLVCLHVNIWWLPMGKLSRLYGNQVFVSEVRRKVCQWCFSLIRE